MLLKKSDDYKKLIDELLFSYGKIKSNVKNGLAIVPIERGAAGGSFLQFSPSNSNGNCQEEDHYR